MYLAEPLTREQADLVAAHVGVAVDVAKHMAHRTGGDYDDLLSDAHLGLMEAAQRWDPTMGKPFDRYAFWLARFRVRDAYRVRTGSRRVRQFDTYSLDHDIGSGDDGRYTLADALEANGHTALCAPGADEVLLAVDAPTDDQATAERALGALYGRAAEVMRRIADGERMATIAADYGVSESRISQIYAEAVNMMKVATGVTERPVVLGRPWTESQRRRVRLMHRKGLPWFRIALAVGHAVSECKAELGVEVRQAKAETFV